jgi:hypothetical protein
MHYKTNIAVTALVDAYMEQLRLYERALASVGIDGAMSQIYSGRVQAAEQ